MKKILKRIYFNIKNFLMGVEIKKQVKNENLKKIFILGVPISGNLGDQAIIEAERKFLSDNFKNFQIIEIDMQFFLDKTEYCRNIIGNNKVYVHGGGYLGTLWFDGEEFFRKVLEVFPENEIIVFPMTVYFDNTKEGNKILEDSKKIYENHKNVKFFLREKYSYDFMKEKFPNCNSYLVPDMVLYNESMNFNQVRQNALFCIRNDREKVKYDFSKITNILTEKLNCKVDYTDTVLNTHIYKKMRNKQLTKKFAQFSKYSLVITDRLHGMVFALLTCTPCIVFENKSYKVLGLYDWIKNNKYIRLYDEKKLENDISELINYSGNYYNKNDIEEKYQELKDTFDLEKK